MAKKPEKDELIGAIDAAVVGILKHVDGEGTVEGANPPSTRDRIAALESAMKWADMRRHIVTDGKEGSKFGGLKDRLRETGGRGNRGPSATDAGRANGHDGGADAGDDPDGAATDPLAAFGAG